ncbi:sodium-dependent transporter [Francisellaceae bacterium]|nr:sodium-dependent transporter [Francisellaceae bacterium]
MDNNRGQWRNQLGFIIVAAGAAIGLGNIWKFPYMAGSNGGSAFVLVYLLCVILIGIPVMAGEIIVGRRAKKNPVDAIKDNAREAGKNTTWSVMGWWGFFGLLLTLSFYCVVSGWAIYYFFITLSGDLQSFNAKEIGSVWGHFMNDPKTMLIYSAIFVALTMGVVALGVQRGLEGFSRVLLPLLFLILFMLVFYAAFTTGHFKQAFHFLFDPDFSKITSTVVINAMGHAFFTLAIGVGAMSIYGSYMGNSLKLGSSILIIVCLDVLVALLSGLAVFPILFAHDLSPAAGPGLMFLTLPIAFAQMPEGAYIGAGFFALIIFAAWTSSINIAEPIVGIIHEKTKLSRKQSCFFIGIVVWLLGMLSVFSFNVWSDVKLFGHFTPFAAITDGVTNIILPIGGIFYAIFAGWVMLPKATKETFALRSNALYQIWRFLVRYVAPLGILIIFIAAVVPH